MPDADTLFLRGPLGKTLHPVRQPVLAIDQEGQQILLLCEAARLDQPQVIGRVISHPHRRRIIETLDEQSRLVIHRRTERPAQKGHPLLASPGFHGGEQRCRSLRVVSAFEKSPDPHLFVVDLIRVSINDAGDSAHRLRTALGEKKDAFGELPERVAVGIQNPANLFLQGWNPLGIGSIDAPWQVNEAL